MAHSAKESQCGSGKVSGQQTADEPALAERKKSLEPWIKSIAASSREPWNNEALLRKVLHAWLDGVSTQKIAAEVHVSKNAVVGKVHRLIVAGLPIEYRPSPIDRSGVRAKPAKVSRASRQTAAREALQTVAPSAVPSDSAPALPVAPPPPPMRVPLGRVSPCCWPIGEPGTPSFHFCDVASMPGKQYCEEHTQLAYEKPATRESRGEAA